MTAVVEKRKSVRIPLRTSIVLEDGRSGFQYQATMCNHSTGGIYVRSKYALRPGRKLRIQTEMSPEDFAHSGSLARVRWRERLTDVNSAQPYGMGLQFC